MSSRVLTSPPSIVERKILKGFHGAFSRNDALERRKDFSSVRHLRRFKKKEKEKKNSGWPEFLVTRLKKEY